MSSDHGSQGILRVMRELVSGEGRNKFLFKLFE